MDINGYNINRLTIQQLKCEQRWLKSNNFYQAKRMTLTFDPKCIRK